MINYKFYNIQNKNTKIEYLMDIRVLVFSDHVFSYVAIVFSDYKNLAKIRKNNPKQLIVSNNSSFIFLISKI